MRALFSLGFLCFAASLSAQTATAPGEMRVSVVLNADGSRTTYETDAANRKSAATTTTTNGKVREKINYDLDENGRYIRGEVLGPKGELRFLALYKYDPNGHLIEETHLARTRVSSARLSFATMPAGMPWATRPMTARAGCSDKPRTRRRRR